MCIYIINQIIIKKMDMTNFSFLPDLICLLFEGLLLHHSICHLTYTRYSFSKRIFTRQMS